MEVFVLFISLNTKLDLTLFSIRGSSLRMQPSLSLSSLHHKLSALGVEDAARDLFSSFLATASQVTCCNNAMSNQESVSTGLAQGSIIGPLLFAFYMNNLPDVLEHCSVTLQ